MPKRFKIKLFSVKLCRSKKPPCLSQKQTLKTLFSPLHTIALDDSYPEPPPSTPNYLSHNDHYSTTKVVPISDTNLKSDTKCDSEYSSYDFGNPLEIISEDSIEGSRFSQSESVTVVKRSENPYEDFKWSMLEMIMEKEMYSVKDLEKLLHRFLSLNSVHYHGALVEAFSEVWEDLFG